MILADKVMLVLREEGSYKSDSGMARGPNGKTDTVSGCLEKKAG